MQAAAALRKTVTEIEQSGRSHISGDSKMRLAEAKVLAEDLKRLYGKLDESAALGVEAQKPERVLSCKKGCDSCCKIMTMATIAEGVVIALGLFKKPDWRSLLPALRASAQEMGGTTSESEYARRGLSCVFLRNHECSIYEDRGAACRLYLVFSPPSECDATDSMRKIESLDTIAMQGQVIIGSAEIFPEAGYVFGPLPLIVLHAMRMLSKKPAEQAELDAALLDLPDPVDWFNRKIAEGHS